MSDYQILLSIHLNPFKLYKTNFKINKSFPVYKKMGCL